MAKTKDLPGTRAFIEVLADAIAERLKRTGPQKALFTVEEAAVFLSCSQEQVRRFMNTKQIPTVKIDSRPRFRVRDLERFVAAIIE